jgi:hypothetical protein
MIAQPLSDAEFEKLQEVLQRFGKKRAMNLEQLDGFLAALICGPDDVPPSDYLPVIWGGEMINEDDFASQPIFQQFVSLLIRHRNAIAHTLSAAVSRSISVCRSIARNVHPRNLFGQDGRQQSWSRSRAPLRGSRCSTAIRNARP